MSANDERRVLAALGPTNTGKTHLAIERMLGRESGVIGLPLRLLAREVYDKIVSVKGPNAAALLTGEEKIAPPGARYFACTVEAMPVSRESAFVAVDEIQLATDLERGHVFTDRILNARGREETMLLGAETMRPLIRKLAPEAEHERRERFSKLTYGGAKKIAKLPRRSAIVAFSAEQVYAIAELLKRQRGGAAIVMGALSPRTRNAQVELYQSGEVDFLVATDAIGMGLNLDVETVAFASLTKFDGRRRRGLRPEEIAQIAGRAGRFRTDGEFVVTGDARPLSDDVVAMIEAHEFEPVRTLQWRNSRLSFASIEALRRTLALPAPDPTLQRSRETVDEIALDTLRQDKEIAAHAQGSDAVERLWSACQLPDFRKVTIDQHVALVRSIAAHLLGPRGVIPIDWIGAHVQRLDKPEGDDVDALASRLAHMRTWTYVANRADWVDDPDHWRGVTRDVEDRLSDALHEALAKRFVDRRTSALVRGLRENVDLVAAVSAKGEVTVEGHYVGKLTGLTFHPDERGGTLDARALRAAASQALRPEINQRLGEIARAEPDAFRLEPDFSVRWAGQKIARISHGPNELHPRVRLIGGELGSSATRMRAQRRIEAWLQHEVAQKLQPLRALMLAVEGGELSGLARGLAYRLVENLGSLDRAEAPEDISSLSSAERRALRAHGVRFGAHDVFVPALLKPAPSRLISILTAAHGGGRAFLPPAGRTAVPYDGQTSRRICRAAGFRVCGRMAVRLDIVDRLAGLLRAARDAAKDAPGFATSAEMTALLGCSTPDLEGVMRALGFRPARNAVAPATDAPATNETAPDAASEALVSAPTLWRAPRPKNRRKSVERAKPPADGPFAALAALQEPPRPAERRKRKPRRRR